MFFIPSKPGPPTFQRLFWKKPTGDTDSFKFLLFFIGNGCPPELIVKWILTSQHWASHAKGEKRARQLNYIVQNLTSKANIWFYFHIYHSQWLYLNGEKRVLCNQSLLIYLCISSNAAVFITTFELNYIKLLNSTTNHTFSL